MFGIPSHRMAICSAILNLVGAFFVFCSFQAAPSKFGLAPLNERETALCGGDNALIIWWDSGFSMANGNRCAAVENSNAVSRIAVVTLDFPRLGLMGWALLFVGFILQIFSIEPSVLTKEDLKTIRKARRLLAGLQ